VEENSFEKIDNSTGQRKERKKDRAVHRYVL
jgi:hypothetical protein